jgi:hypothetical protein
MLLGMQDVAALTLFAGGGPGHRARVVLEGMGSGIVLGCRAHVPESVWPGKKAWCVMCCAVCRGLCAARRGHTPLHRQPERALGVLAGVVERERGDQPGAGELCMVDDLALWRLCVWMHACTNGLLDTLG